MLLTEGLIDQMVPRLLAIKRAAICKILVCKSANILRWGITHSFQEFKSRAWSLAKQLDNSTGFVNLVKACLLDLGVTGNFSKNSFFLLRGPNVGAAVE